MPRAKNANDRTTIGTLDSAGTVSDELWAG